MAEQAEDVKPVVEAPVAPSAPEAPQAQPVSEDVKPPEKDYGTLYENTKKALQEAREKERAERATRIALEQQIQSQAQVQPEQDDEAVQRFYANEAKTDLLIKAQTDPFVRDNIAVLSEEIANNPTQGADIAITRLKASYMDNIIKSSDIVSPKPVPTTSSPQATPEDTPEVQSLDPNLPDLEARLNEKLGS